MCFHFVCFFYSCGRICRAKLGRTFVGLRFYSRFGVRFLVGRLPFDPSVVDLGAILSVVVFLRKYFRGEHCGRCEEKECFFRDFLAGSPHLLLYILEHIGILGDALDFELVAPHFIMQRQKVEGVTTRASRLKVRK